MKFQRIDPNELTPKRREIYNYQKSAAILADYGFNCIKLADDWQGADFLADHISGNQTLRVQLKSRLTVNKKYQDKNLWMIFPEAGTWYLIPHDELLRAIAETTGALESKSWRERGEYHYPNGQVPKDLLAELRPFALEIAQLPDSDRPAGKPGNIQQATEVLTQAGYTCTTAGMRDVDVLAQQEDALQPIKVRCPGRLSIWEKYLGEDLYICFQDQHGVWYLIPHDKLVRIAGDTTRWLNSPSWQDNGWYSSANPSAKMQDKLRPFALNAGN